VQLNAQFTKLIVRIQGFCRKWTTHWTFAIDLVRQSSQAIVMDADERDICQYLKGWPGQFVSYGEIARRAAGKRRYRQEPDWASTVLARLVETGSIESDSTGHYRLKAVPKKEKSKRWVSPQIRKILEQSGKTFDIEEEAEED